MPGSAAVLRIVAGQHNETAAAGALQLCGVRDKLIADAERIVRGQHGVFQRVERAADADAGQPTPKPPSSPCSWKPSAIPKA